MDRRVVIAVLLVLVSAWAAILLVGLKRDLPSPEADEPYFVLPAVEMAAHGDANPHWFGHPASTVISPLAIVYRMRETVFHGGPVFGASPGVADRFQDDADSFYILGRLWVVLLTLATVPVLFLVGRRLLGSGGALLATGCWMLVPIVVQYGRIVRSDSAGTLFGLLALLACLRALDKPTAARFMVGGAAIGVAISSRYFMVALIPVLMTVWWLARRRDRSMSIRSLALGLGASVAAFVATTPYFLFDWRHAELSLRAETVGTIGNQHFGLMENLKYYLGTALPHVLSWPVLVLAGLGVAIALARRDAKQLLLIGYVTLFLGGISLSHLHWERWTIPILPVLALFAVSAVLEGVREVSRRVRLQKRRLVFAGAMALGLAALVIQPAVGLTREEQRSLDVTTRQLMRSWVMRHLPVGTKIGGEVKAPELASAGYKVWDTYDLPTSGTVADYVAHGYRYFIVNAYISVAYRARYLNYHRHSAFYLFLRRHSELLADFAPHGSVTGPQLKLYRVDPASLLEHHGLSDRSTTVRSANGGLRHEPKLYPVGAWLLRDDDDVGR